MSSLKIAADSDQKIEEVVDIVNNRLLADNSSIPAQTTQLNGSLTRQNHPSSCTSNVAASDPVLDPRSNEASDQREPQIPSELIANCVATLLMIQVSNDSHLSTDYIWHHNTLIPGPLPCSLSPQAAALLKFDKFLVNMK